MSIHENHPFHIVNKRPWPLTGAIGAIVTLIGLIKWFHQYDDSLLGIGAIITLLTIIQWWRDVTREGTYQGLHTKIVTKGLRWGIILFIVSEVLFFVSFFWAFFHTSLSPTIERRAKTSDKTKYNLLVLINILDAIAQYLTNCFHDKPEWIDIVNGPIGCALT